MYLSKKNNSIKENITKFNSSFGNKSTTDPLGQMYIFFFFQNFWNRNVINVKYLLTF